MIDGKRYDAPFTMYHYNIRDIQEMIGPIGFSIDKTDGNWSGETFCQTSKRMIFKLQKPLI